MGRPGEAAVCRRRVRRRLALAAEVGDRLGQMPQRNGLDAGQLGLGRRLGGAEETGEAGPTGALGSRQHPTDGTDAAVECELAERRVPGQCAVRDLPRCGDDGERDRQVEARAFLPQPGRREVDGNAPDRPFELGGRDPNSDSLFGFLTRSVGKADDREARDAELQVRFDLDAARLEADERVRDRPREHLPTLAAKV